MSITNQQSATGKQSLYHSITDQILTDIREGQYPLGAKLPSQAECVEKYGVSVTTVRQAISRLEKMGYVRREHGRGVFVSVNSSSKPATKLTSLGLLIEEGVRSSDRPTEERILLTIRRVCSRENIRLSVVESRLDMRQGGLALLEACQGLQVDGFLITPKTVEAEEMARLVDVLPAAVVLETGVVDEPQPIDLIDVDLVPGIADLLDHAASLGHRQIAYVTAEYDRCLAGDPHVTRGRWQQYRDRMTRNGSDLDTSLVLPCPASEEPDATFERNLLGIVRRDDPATLIMAENDWIARQCLQVLWNHNIHVPRDVSVIGFDDHDFAARLVPGLSTVALPMEAACRAALRMLRARLAQPETGPQRMRLTTTMKLRQTLATPKDS